jgi:hypothetical protein
MEPAVTSSSNQTPSLAEEEAPQVVLERTKVWSWVPTGPETKNDCAAESQQQITALYSYAANVILTPRDVTSATSYTVSNVKSCVT